jgi:hypothetical protein
MTLVPGFEEFFVSANRTQFGVNFFTTSTPTASDGSELDLETTGLSSVNAFVIGTKLPEVPDSGSVLPVLAFAMVMTLAGGHRLRSSAAEMRSVRFNSPGETTNQTPLG